MNPAKLSRFTRERGLVMMLVGAPSGILALDHFISLQRVEMRTTPRECQAKLAAYVKTCRSQWMTAAIRRLVSLTFDQLISAAV